MLEKTPTTLVRADPDIIDHLFELQRVRKSLITYKNKARQVVMSFLVRDIIPPDEDKKTKLKAAYKRAGAILDAFIDGEEASTESDANGLSDAELVKRRFKYLNMAKISLAPVFLYRDEIEEEMRGLASRLPVMKFVDEYITGMNALGLAVLVAEAGDLSNYPKVRHLWKRFELDCYQGFKRSSWRRGGAGKGWPPVGLSKETWEKLGAAPRKLGQLYGVVTMPVFQAKKNSVFGVIYAERRTKTMITHPEWGEGKPLNASGWPTSRHADMDAKGIMTKEVVKLVYFAWKREHGLSDNYDPALDRSVNEYRAEAGLPPIQVVDFPLPPQLMAPADARARRGAPPVTPTTVQPPKRGRGRPPKTLRLAELATTLSVEEPRQATIKWRSSKVIGTIDDSGEPIPEERRSPQSSQRGLGTGKHRQAPRSASKQKY